MPCVTACVVRSAGGAPGVRDPRVPGQPDDRREHGLNQPGRSCEPTSRPVRHTAGLAGFLFVHPLGLCLALDTRERVVYTPWYLGPAKAVGVSRSALPGRRGPTVLAGGV